MQVPRGERRALLLGDSPKSSPLPRVCSLRLHLQENGDGLWLFLIQDSDAVEETAWGGHEVSTAAGGLRAALCRNDTP